MAKIEVKVKDVVGVTSDYTQLVVLQTLDKKFSFPIIIAANESSALQKELHQLEAKRPQTHDLMYEMLQRLDVEILEIFIHTIREGIFYTTIHCLKDEQFIEFDARPSDALVLALKANAPIFVDAFIIKTLGIKTEDVINDFNDSNVLENLNTIENIRLDNDSCIPSPSLDLMSLEQLEYLLKIAVEEENFEIASHLRDLINERKSNM